MRDDFENTTSNIDYDPEINTYIYEEIQKIIKITLLILSLIILFLIIILLMLFYFKKFKK